MILKIKAAQIARDLGLSKATVSLALNDKPGVSQETKELIFDYIKRIENGEIINSNSLIKIVNYSKKTNTHSNEVDLWGGVLNAFALEAKKDGFTLGIDYINDDDDQINKLVLECNQANVAGVIVFANELDEDKANLFKKINKPLVFYDNDFNDDRYSYVMVDNYRGLEKIILLIKEKGFSNIAYLANSDMNFNFNQRRMAFNALLQKYDLNGKIFVTGNDVASSYQIIKSNLKNSLYPPVLICENYQVSIGAIKAIEELKLIFKQDVSLIGIDEIPDYFCYGKHLTALKIPHDQRAYLAMTLLKKEIEKKSEDKFRIYGICKIIEGDTL